MDKKKYLITYHMKSGKLIEIVVLSDMNKKQLIESLQREMMSSSRFFVAHESHIINKEEISFIECEVLSNE